ncbi:2-oxo acid dehydrogenase subunit E2 [Candidatus Atribacteria bacterium HGW-Atribacteria-1]|nr:MAG: 2-oxo acid dehydrogenase subunit E2 [Candidatus Atribacteria bacterium HGW-Atribacteria-1]
MILPKQGQSVESCLIIKWNKKVGDKVKAEEPICEVETDKAVFEVEAPEAGTMLKIFYKEGDDVPVLSTIAIIGQPGEKIGHLIPKKTVSVSKEEYVEKQKVITPNESTKKIKPSFGAGLIPISPVARRFAEKEGIDFSKLIGSGPGGRIIKKDIEKAISEGEPLIPSTVSKKFFGPVKEIPVEGVRKIISERMLRSLQSTAQLTLNTSVDASNLLACRKSLKSSPQMKGLSKININDFLLYIVAKNLPKFRALNAHFLKDKILEFEQVHLGFAVDSPRGLMVPIIHNAHLLSLEEISKEARRLSTACQEETILPDELNGGTFTVTNLGTMGIESFTPILNIPQVAILGVCSVSLKPIMKEDKIQFIPHLGLSLTFDHRAVDGAPAAKFLQELNMVIANFDLTDIKL